MVSPLPAG